MPTYRSIYNMQPLGSKTLSPYHDSRLHVVYSVVFHDVTRCACLSGSMRRALISSGGQIQDPTNTFLVHQTSVSSGDHSFDAKADGKHIYCFSNEHWTSSTKEVSFNVHGIVYVPESEESKDPLEREGEPQIPLAINSYMLRSTVTI